MNLLLCDSHGDGDPESPAALQRDLQSVRGGGGVPRGQQQRSTRARGTESEVMIGYCDILHYIGHNYR